MARVWLKSRVPGKTVRLEDWYVLRDRGGYADVVWSGRRFRFSHEAMVRDETGSQQTWLVFEDAGAADPV